MDRHYHFLDPYNLVDMRRVLIGFTFLLFGYFLSSRGFLAVVPLLLFNTSFILLLNKQNNDRTGN